MDAVTFMLALVIIEAAIFGAVLTEGLGFEKMFSTLETIIRKRQ